MVARVQTDRQMICCRLAAHSTIHPLISAVENHQARLLKRSCRARWAQARCGPGNLTPRLPSHADSFTHDRSLGNRMLHRLRMFKSLGSSFTRLRCELGNVFSCINAMLLRQPMHTQAGIRFCPDSILSFSNEVTTQRNSAKLCHMLEHAPDPPPSWRSLHRSQNR